MESLSETQKRILEAAHEQISEELDELFELPAGVSQEEFIGRLWNDDNLRSEIRERFEHGKSSGKFPLLSRFWSGLPDEVKEEFFSAGWMSVAIPPEPPDKPWDYSPYNGDIDYYRKTSTMVWLSR